MQERVGGPAAFERFLRAYIQAKRYQVHTSQDMRAFFCDFFKHQPAIKQIDWDAWLTCPGVHLILDLQNLFLSSSQANLRVDSPTISLGL